jgi:outer membrane receptor for ferrienterochelin and colicins
VVNLFTEEHAALTGARSIDVQDALAPEKSYNVNLNYIKKIYAAGGTFIGLDATAFYTHFNNKIIPDYDTDPNRIIYKNLKGYAVSSGLSANLDVEFKSGLKLIAGAIYLDVFTMEGGAKRAANLNRAFHRHLGGVL